MARSTLPPFLGIRVKALNDELKARAVRTLDLFLTALVEATRGKLPSGFVVTLPKVTSPKQVQALAEILAGIELALGLSRGAVEIELMIETPRAVLGPHGEVSLRGLAEAADGRCRAVHFGAYDYTASCGITADNQRLTHPACDFARHLMLITFAGTGVWLCDGATTVLPIARHRAAPGLTLSAEQTQENRAVVHGAMRLHYDNIRHAAAHGFYQGWDLHPAQLPVRYAAVYASFDDSLQACVSRLKNFVEKAARATRVGEVFDDAATGQGLLNVFVRGISSGAVTEEEATRLTGLSAAELRGRSFARILENRRQDASGSA
jgi:citrate lyase beta subunit